jgi:hypothetical protein
MTKHSKSLPKAKPATTSATATNKAKPATTSATATTKAKLMTTSATAKTAKTAKKERISEQPGQGQSATPAGRFTIGLDLGDRSTAFCVLDNDGAIVAEGKLKTTQAAIHQQFARLRRRVTPRRAAALDVEHLAFDGRGLTITFFGLATSDGKAEVRGDSRSASRMRKAAQSPGTRVTAMSLSRGVLQFELTLVLHETDGSRLPWRGGAATVPGTA